WRRRPRVGTMRGGGGQGASGRRSLACAQASQCGFMVSPSKGLGSRWGCGGGGFGVVEHATAGALGHNHWSLTHSHTRSISTKWKKKRWETMAQPPHTGGEMRGFYPVCQVTELAAGYRDTTYTSEKPPFCLNAPYCPNCTKKF